jgi:HEAT repeat protein
MKTLKTIIITVIASALMGLSAQAQDVRLLSTKVADILAQMPAKDLVQRDKAVLSMIQLGDQGIAEIAKLIVPAGTGDDTGARNAISALSLTLGQTGTYPEADRLMVSKAFIKAMDQATDKGIKAFYMYHLKFFANQEAVGPVAKYLSDDYLVESAAAVLVNMKNHPAMHALKIALPEMKGKSQMIVVKGLGDYGALCADSSIRSLAGTTDPNLKKMVLYALGQIGSKASAEVMVNAAKQAKFGYEPTEATRSLVNFADNLAKSGEAVMVKRICTMMVKESQGPDNISNGLAAMEVMTKNYGFEALDMLMAAVKSPDPKYRAGALNLAVQIKDIAAVRKWIDMAKEAQPEVAAEIVAMLCQIGDPVALPLFRKSAVAESPVLRSAALLALVKMQGKEVLPMVLADLKKATGAELDACASMLNTIVGLKQIDQVAAAIDEVPAVAKPVLINLIGTRKATAQFDKILKLTADADPAVSAAAYKVLPLVSTASNTAALIGLLETTKNPASVASVQDALVSTALTVEKPADRTKTLIEAYQTRKALKEKLLGVLPRIGGDESLKLISTEFSTQKGAGKDQAFAALTKWKDTKACDQLYAIASAGPEKYKAEAFSAYVSKISKSRTNADQKLLLLRKVMTLAVTPEQKKMVIQGLDGNRTFLTLVYVAKYLDDKDLQNNAARVAMGIALPPSGTKEGMYGETVKGILTKCIAVISGEESDYAKENMRNWIAAMPKDAGFVPMFNGKDLTGWKGLVENPVARAKMSKDELAQKQKAVDATIGESWTVKDGMIVFNGKGNNLCSVKDYADFEMWVDWRITKDGDSGLYLRGTPQVQIWDTTRHDVGAQVGSGGLYNNQKNPAKPTQVADNLVNDWNTFYIKMVGEKVTVKLNGITVVDNVTLENYWDRKIPIFPSGAIELQAHGTDLGFRDIYVREIKSEDYGLTVSEQADGFTALFNGKNLDGWVGNKTDYKVDNGEILVEPTGGGGSGNLYTEKEYADFAYRFEFQLTPGANNGIGIRAPLEGDAAYVGMEIQVLDNTAPVYANLQKYQYHGSVYGVIPARREFLKPVGEWNEEEIWIQGTHIKITLNGTIIVDGDIAEASKNGTIDHNQHPGLKNAKGHIGFLGHGSILRFRNIRIKTL